MHNNFYDTWAEKELKNTSRNNILKWKAVNLVNIYLRTNINMQQNSICEIGGAEGIVLNTIADLLNIDNRFVFDISYNFCHYGRSIYPKTIFINNIFYEKVDTYFDIIVLSDIIEHVKGDEELLRIVSEKCKYILIKIPIEKCIMNNRFYYFIRHGKKLPVNLRYGITHKNGHLRGYNISDAKKLVSKYFYILDEQKSDVLYFYGSKSHIMIRNILGIRIAIFLFGGAFFILGKSKNNNN